MTLTFSTARRHEVAFAAAMTFLAAHEPFKRQPLGPIAGTVSGAIKRSHYVLGIDEGKIVAFVAWALTDLESAQKWLVGDFTPTFEETQDGDTVVLMMGGGVTSKAVMLGIRYVGSLYPGRHYVIKRFGRNKINSGRFPSFRVAPIGTSGT